MFKIQKNGENSSVMFYCTSKEFSGVKKIAQKVCLDVERVTGGKPEIKNIDSFSSNKDFKNAVFFVTLGKFDSITEKIALENNLDLTKISGKRESYIFAVSEEHIIVIGSDKRGTIYGLFYLSQLMGVSPLVDWADFLPKHQDCVQIEENIIYSKEPSVRFRGFFINDEWPACGNWCNHNFGGFNSKMYEHVFELLLRLKGNYLWPAMWTARFSDEGPGLENAELADELGVIMGTSHHEPCCRAGEEYRYLRGKNSVYGDAWNFRANEKGITKFWEDGLKRNGKFENVITVGMRGEADTAIMQNATLKDNIDLLRDVLKIQNKLIKENVNQNLDKVPRMLALYKEVEPYFYGDETTQGLMDSPELEGVTLMLCDDNHGNLRTVPTEKMRNHKGGYGMYYHFDYHGAPFSYEWFNTNYLPKVKEQMCAAYDFGIRDLWIVNVGDIMTNEFPLSYFLDLAYDYETVSVQTTFDYTKNWVEQNFNGLENAQKQEICEILNDFTKIANMRRTESIQNETYAPINFNESSILIEKANKITEKAEKLKTQMPQNLLGGYFLEVYLPACGVMNILRMQLYSGKNVWFAKKGAVIANFYAKKVKECYNYDLNLLSECDAFKGGKFFASGRSEHFGFTHWCEAENHYPTYTYVEPARKGKFIFWIEGSDKTTTAQDWTDRVLKFDGFKNPNVKEFSVFVANCAVQKRPYKISFKSENDKKSENSFLEAKIVPSEICDENNVSLVDRIVISINREKLSKIDEKSDVLVLESNDGQGAGIKLFVEIDANVPNLEYPKGTFVQTTDYISIEAEHFIKASSLKEEKDGVTNGHFEILQGYGKTLSAVKAFPVINSYNEIKNAPYVEYQFVPSGNKTKTFDFYLNPSNPAYKNSGIKFIAQLNGKNIEIQAVKPDFTVGDNQEPWGTDVTNNIRISKMVCECCDGINTLRIYPVTPNVVLEKIVIYSDDVQMPKSYLGAPETFRV